MVVLLLSSAGDHVPVIPLLEVVGSGDNGEPAHIGATALNVGVIFAIEVNVAVIKQPFVFV